MILPSTLQHLLFASLQLVQCLKVARLEAESALCGSELEAVGTVSRLHAPLEDKEAAFSGLVRHQAALLYCRHYRIVQSLLNKIRAP